MVYFIIDVHKTLYPDQEVPKSLYEKRTTVVATFKRLQDENQLILKTFQDPKVHQQLQQNRDSKQLIDYLVQNHDFKIEMIDKCYEYAKCLYETGNYGDAAKFLYIHRILVQPTDRNYLNGIWGKLASEILMQNWDAALEDLKRLQQFIDESTFGSSLQLLQQRTWLIHWSLFVFFNHPKGRGWDSTPLSTPPRTCKTPLPRCPRKPTSSSPSPTPPSSSSRRLSVSWILTRMVFSQPQTSWLPSAPTARA